MNTNPQPSPTQKRRPRSFAPAPASPRQTFRNNEQRCASADPRIEIDCIRLDVRAAIPGAHRELGPAHLHVTVDPATGRIVDCHMRFGAKAATPISKDSFKTTHRRASKSPAERALCRLLRSKLPR